MTRILTEKLSFRRAARLYWRWAVVFTLILAMLMMEALEHGWVNGRPEPHFVLEVLVYGVVFPAVLWLVTRSLGRAETERVQAEERLDHYFALSQKISRAASWNALTRAIVELPFSIFPASRSILYLYDAQAQCFTRLTAAEHGAPLPFEPEAGPEEQLLTPETGGPKSGQLAPLNGKPGWYCLPLVHGNAPVGALTFGLEPGLRPTPRQAQLLNSAAPEMALAMHNFHLQDTVTAQAARTESERRRVARDLHDSLGQNIGYLRLKLDQLITEDALLSISSIREDLQRMRDTADEAYRQVRVTLDDLHPAGSQEFTAALMEQARQTGGRAGFEVRLSQQGSPRPLSAGLKRQALYICREALNNIEKHANATCCDLSLAWHDNDLTITIMDDGAGFDAAAVETVGHFGLQIMEERAREINGVLKVKSSQGEGTTVTLWVPAASGKAREAN